MNRPACWNENARREVHIINQQGVCLHCGRRFGLDLEPRMKVVVDENMAEGQAMGS